MSTTASRPDVELAGALREIAAGAAARDAAPSFPHDAFAQLRAVGALARPDAGLAAEWATARAVAAADGSVGRIFDGHLNALDRLAAVAPDPLRAAELQAAAAGERLLGVWGADPLPHEGARARLRRRGSELTVAGVKVFCSGAGGIDRALVLVGGPDDVASAPWLAYVDLGEGVDVDREWFRGAGMRASESHRVVFSDAPVLAVLGDPGELGRDPWFGRDAIRTAATWAGVADAALAAALDALAARGEPDDLLALAAGRMLAAQGTVDAWLAHAAAALQAPDPPPATPLSARLRAAVAQAGAAILDEAGRACGSRPFAAATTLDRARRDFELFVLQHRLDPLLARAGRAAIEARR